jgi:exosortase E/protease (VPEID-CTERM system)
MQSISQDPVALTIGGSRFTVTIAPECSGIEGMGMILVLTVAWLWFFRREYRYPAAFLLLPVGIGTMWLVNVIRISVLIFIGEAGAPDVAVGGFHSQAGWIGFLLVAWALLEGSRRWSWASLTAPQTAPYNDSKSDAGAAYLMPFLAILAASLISQAVSSGFEWLYPLRFFAAAAALWCFRRRYARLDWSFSWVGLLGGVAVLVIWMGLERLYPPATLHSIAGGLSHLSTAPKVIWIGFRIAAAVVTVPLAEEIAFRGFLMRRLISADFESVSSRAYTPASFLISSVAFGILHGDRWLAGVIAGVIYGWIFVRRGSIGDAVLAHAVTNALLAVWVLSTGAWQLW